MRGHPVKRSGIVHLLYIFVLSFFCSALKSPFFRPRLTAAGARRARSVKDGAIARQRSDRPDDGRANQHGQEMLGGISWAGERGAPGVTHPRPQELALTSHCRNKGQSSSKRSALSGDCLIEALKARAGVTFQSAGPEKAGFGYPRAGTRLFGCAGAAEGFSPPPAITPAVQGMRSDKIFPKASFSPFAASASSADFTGALPSKTRAATM